MKNSILTALLCLTSFPVYSQDALSNFEFLIGNWQGVESGVSGNGIGFRTYTYELNRNYIFSKNSSHFPISENYPNGEVHRDIAVISYNGNTSKVVLREFQVEGFTLIYELNEAASTTTTLVFLSREIENNPGKWKARHTTEKISNDEFKEKFEIARDGVNFKTLISNHWKRVY